MKDWQFYALTALGLVLLPFVIHPIGGYPALATQILLLGIGAIGFNLLLGYAGLLSYGQAMFYGVGAYVALLTVSRFFPQVHSIWLGILLAVVFVGVMALLIGMLTVRLYGIYFALLTLAFAQMFFFIVFQWRSLTRGDDGLQGITAPPLTFGPWSLDLTQRLPDLNLGIFGNLHDVTYWYPFSAVVVLGVLAFVRTLTRSQYGEILAAIRENEERSTFVGFDSKSYRIAAFTIAGVLTGLSGALKGLFDTSIAVDSLDVETSGSFVIYAVVGGVKTLFGPLLGTAIIQYLQNVISGNQHFGEAWRLIEGVIFVAVIAFWPKGLLGSIPQPSEFAYQPRFRPSDSLPEAKPMTEGIILETKGLSKFFGAFGANSDIDFKVRAGELRAVIGPNGAGKTTFFNVLSGLRSASAGTIYFKGRDITRMPGPQRVASGIAKAFQTASIYPDESVFENVRLAALARVQGMFAPEFLRRSGRLQQVDDIAHDALEQLDLSNVATTRAGSLSHGDKKRLDIAVALATQPELLLLDEPVAGMSIDEIHKTDRLIRALAKRMTVLIIEHDMDLVMGISDSITVLHQGKVLAEGTPAEIRANRLVQEAYLGGHVADAVPSSAPPAAPHTEANP
ncbi:MAG: branched-chain amino acid ABC transporter ATP-binding protein/permease [Candidatus Eremiobacteraeota bacterium]|nr:branched-chain amino acid ABC transporter ATP-binding protein/permease [Candidatus Eremiobacteraeota bacterium]